MKKHEFANILRRCGMNYTSFALLVEYDHNSIIRWGKNGEDIPKWASILMKLIHERGSCQDLFRHNR